MSITSSGLPDVNLGPLTTPFTANPGCLNFNLVTATNTGTSTVTANYQNPAATSSVFITTATSAAVLSAIYLNGGGFSTDRPFFTSIDPASGCYPSQQRWLPDYIANGSAQHVYYSPATCPQTWTRTLVGSDVTNGTTYATDLCCQPSLTPTTSLSAFNNPGPATSSLQISKIWYCVTVLTTQTVAYGSPSSTRITFNQQSLTTSFSVPGLFVKYQAADVLSLSSVPADNSTVSTAATDNTGLSRSALIGTIVGSVIGGISILSGIGLLFFIKRRRNKKADIAMPEAFSRDLSPSSPRSRRENPTLGPGDLSELVGSVPQELNEKDAVSPGDPRALMFAENVGTIDAPTDPRMVDEISAAPVDPRRTVSTGERIFGSNAAPVDTDSIVPVVSPPAVNLSLRPRPILSSQEIEI